MAKAGAGGDQERLSKVESMARKVLRRVTEDGLPMLAEPKSVAASSSHRIMPAQGRKGQGQAGIEPRRQRICGRQATARRELKRLLLQKHEPSTRDLPRRRLLRSGAGSSAFTSSASGAGACMAQTFSLVASSSHVQICVPVGHMLTNEFRKSHLQGN